MTDTEGFYRVLGVPPDAEPGAVREQVRERVDEFERQVENADDPETVERRLILAYEVLTDPEERYLYELFGHEEYVSRRLDGQELTDVSGIGGGIAPVFSGEASTTDTQVFDPADQSTDTKIFDPNASESAVAGATTVVGDADADTDTDGPESPASPDTADTPGSDDSATDAETVVRKEAERPDSSDPETVEDDDGTIDAETGAESDEQELSTVIQDSSAFERLRTFPLSQSPLVDLPGIRSGEYRRPAAVGYGALVLILVFGIGAAVPYGSVGFGVAAAGGGLVGAAVTYVAGATRFERRLPHRTGVGIAVLLPILWLVDLVLTTTTPGSVLAIGTLAAGLTGVAAGNTYIESTRKRIREGRKGEGERGGRNFTATDPTLGEHADRVDAEDILERLVDTETGRMSRPPGDLSAEATVHATRQFAPERHVFRTLTVTDERTGREVPVSEFSAVRANLREDVDRRNDNHPDGFVERTDRYLVPSSVTERVCPKCEGETIVRCPTCGGNGTVVCSACGGDTRTRCGRCGGKGRDADGDLCSKCRGDGYNPCRRCSATGAETCGTCAGDGIVQCDRCEADGRVVQFTQLTRTYTPRKDTEYEAESIPEEYLQSPDGTQIRNDLDRNRSPDAIEGDWFFKEHEVREIPTTVVTYEYAGNLWEVYEMEDGVKSPTYPRALETRTRYLGVATVASALLFVYAGTVGPAGLP